MKLLIYLPESITDVIAITPVLRLLKVQIEEAEITIICSGENEEVLQDNPYVDYQISTREAFQQIRNKHFYYLIDLQGNWLLRQLARFYHTKVLKMQHSQIRDWMRSHFKMNKIFSPHFTDRVIALLKPLNIKPDELGLDYFIPHKDIVPSNWLPLEFNNEFVLLSLSAPYQTRKLPVDRVIELCDRINKPIVLVGGSEDKEMARKIELFYQRSNDSSWEEGLNRLNKKTRIFNAVEKFGINQIASLIKQSDYVFCFDSEIVPMASAFKKQIFLILGNTTTLSGKYPYQTRFTILENNRVNCRPCSSKGYDDCPKGHFNCMKKIVFDFYIP